MGSVYYHVRVSGGFHMRVLLDQQQSQPMVRWQREFFHLAGSMLACREASLNYPDPLPDGSLYCPYGWFVGELAVGVEMHLVLREAGMLPAQRLARCAGRLLTSRVG